MADGDWEPIQLAQQLVPLSGVKNAFPCKGCQAQLDPFILPPMVNLVSHGEDTTSRISISLRILSSHPLARV